VGELRREVGFLFQTPVMFPGTVRGNLREAAEIAGIDPSRFEDAARQALRRAELDGELLDRDGDELSVGQQQRVNLARVLVTGPEVLLLDEPTSALDPPTAARLLATVERLVAEEGLSVVMATHRLAEARRASDRAVMLADGAVVEAGPTSRVLDDPEREETARFVDSAR
ncbi:MAG: ATP-binding cassette domain-containing protein, partial [Gemmatimonadota bacterium]